MVAGVTPYDSTVTLAQRLLLAIAVLTVTTATMLAFGVREAWRRTEEERFRESFLETRERLAVEVERQTRELPEIVGPLCADHPLVDATLVDLRAGRLGPGQRLSLAERVPMLKRGLPLDELVLVTGEGEVLGAGDKALVGTTDRALAARITGRTSGRAPGAGVRTTAPLAIQAHCARTEGRVTVGFYAARHVEPLLREVAQSHGVSLSLGAAGHPEDSLTDSFELAGLQVRAERSRVPLHAAIRRLDFTILLIGLGVLAVAMALAGLLSRGLARPIVALSEQAREVVTGDPKPVRGSGGKELELFAASFNQAIADLTAMRRRLAATERIAARREIARRVAHEIKNPLAPIRASVETLRRLRARSDPAFDEYFDEATRTVLDEVTRINTIVSEFTRFARLPPPNPEPMALAEAVQHVVSLHGRGDVRIDLDAQPCPTVRADRDQIIQVLTNLVQNAIDAAATSREPRVGLTLAPRGKDHVQIVVRDNGPGVAPEMRDRLFEPYATTKATGTGLGLAIVERIVFEHGGEITHGEAPGGGAVFTVTLPVGGPALLPEAPASEP